MEDWKPEATVKVTLHLTETAARILYQYAGERSRGRFVSALLVQQRERDDRVTEVTGRPVPTKRVVHRKRKKAHR